MHARWRRRASAGIVPALVIAAASVALAEGESPPTPAGAPRPSPAPTDPKEIDRAACEAWAMEFQSAVERRDRAAVGAMADWPSLMATVTRGLDVPAAVVAEFEAGVRSASPFESVALAAVERGATLRFLRCRSRDGLPTPTFRIVFPNGGVNYVEPLLARDGSGRIRMADVYTYLSAERMSDMFRRGLLLARAADEADRGGATEEARRLQLVVPLMNADREGRWKAALDAYAALPEVLRREKFILLLRLRAAQQAGAEAYAACVADFRLYHPKDPCIDILAVDAHVAAGEFDAALACVDRVDESVGGDPFLGVMRANLHLARGEPAKARVAARRAADAEPSLEPAHWALVDASLAEKDFDATARHLTHIETAFGVALGNLAEAPVFAEFAASGAYAAWMKARRERAPATEGRVEGE